MLNPMQQIPALFLQNSNNALHANDSMRRTPGSNMATTPLPQKQTPNDFWNSPVNRTNMAATRLPQKQTPDDFWNSPVNRMNLFEGPVPMFPQPTPNTLLPQPTKQGYEFIDNDIEITGAAYNAICKAHAAS